MREIHDRHLGQGRGRRGGGRRAENSFDVGLHIVLGNAALDAGSLDSTQIGAQLAREFAHRWTGISLGEGLLVDAGLAARRRGRGRGRRGGRRGRSAPQALRRPARLREQPWRRLSGAGAARARQQRRLASGSISKISEPSETLSPFLRLTCVILPAMGAGTSMAAFSVSMVISGVSFSICWPSLTSTSMTLTSLNPPMSGTRTSVGLLTTLLDRHGIGFFRIDAECLHGLGHRLSVDLALVGKRLERRDGHVVAVHFKETAQFGARVAASVAIGAEHRISAGYPLPDLIRNRLHIIGCRNERPVSIRQCLLNVGLLARLACGCSRFQRSIASAFLRSSLKLVTE